VTYTCLQTDATRFTHLSWDFLKTPCPAGIMTTIPFPPCWDGKNLDSPNHKSHVAYPDGAYDRGAECPASHPVNIPQIVMEFGGIRRGSTMRVFGLWKAGGSRSCGVTGIGWGMDIMRIIFLGGRGICCRGFLIGCIFRIRMGVACWSGRRC